jgi:hypothetical protein
MPDFLVGMEGGVSRLLEVKPSWKLDDAAVRRKLAVAGLFAGRRGWVFHVLTEREVRRGCLLANLRLLRRYRRLPADAALAERLVGLVPAVGVPLGDLARSAAEAAAESTCYARLFHLLCSGRISFDPGACPLGPDARLFPQGGVPWDPFVSAWAPSGCSTGGPTASCASPPPTSSSPST